MLKNYTPLLFKSLAVMIFCISIAQTFFFLEKNQANIDDIGVAETLFLRKYDYEKSCEEFKRSYVGEVSNRFLTENSICKLSRTLVRFNAIPAIWTYAPLQFWITQNLLDPKIHPRNYSDIKLYGRLPAFFFYLVGIVGFYFLLRKTIPGINNSALLSLVLTLVLGISFQERLLATQMHSYAIGILSNVLIIYAGFQAGKFQQSGYLRYLIYGTLMALGVAMQYQAVLLLLAAIFSLFWLALTSRGRRLPSIIKISLTVSATFSLIYLFCGDITRFSSRGINWNVGPNSAYAVTAESYFTRIVQLVRILIVNSPENFSYIILGFEPDRPYTLIFGLLLVIIFALGLLYLAKEYKRDRNRFLPPFIFSYLAIYCIFIYLGKLTYSPTRHFIYFLPTILIVMGYGTFYLGPILTKPFTRPILKVIFLGYLLFCVYFFGQATEKMRDLISENLFSSLLIETNSKLLIFDRVDFEVLFVNALDGTPKFSLEDDWSCQSKQILVPRARELNVIWYSKSRSAINTRSQIEGLLTNIFQTCSAYSNSAKVIGMAIDDLVDINGQRLQLLRVQLNFDSNQYHASLVDGIDFKRSTYPDFLDYVSGMSVSEPWGRWTDLPKDELIDFGFKSVLPQNFKVRIKTRAFNPRASKFDVQVGDITKSIPIKNNGLDNEYEVEFHDVSGVKNLYIKPPPPLSPHQVNNLNLDTRKLGLGLISIKIEAIN